MTEALAHGRVPRSTIRTEPSRARAAPRVLDRRREEKQVRSLLGNYIRAVTGWPLGDGSRHSDVTMLNLIGDDVADVPRLARESGTALHLYGKAEARPGRKMGHVNRIT